jgi:hypothetical protein
MDAHIISDRSNATRASVGLTVSIDTEEDNWTPATRDITTRNISQLPKLAALFERLGVRATYFTTYQAAICAESASVLRALHGSGSAEIAAHLHPWNTPPLCGIESAVSMLLSYPPEVQELKIARLVDALRSQLHIEPVSFRAGRFGLGATTIPMLLRSGLHTDSSVTPLLSWEKHGGPSFLRAPRQPYRIDAGRAVTEASLVGDVTEVPVTVGYTRFRGESWVRIARFLGSPVARRLRLAGLSSRLGLVQRVILSPETNNLREMLRLSRQMIAIGARHLHMFFHSGSLSAGLTPFARSARDVQRMYDTIEGYVHGLEEMADVTFCTTSEAAKRYVAGNALAA